MLWNGWQSSRGMGGSFAMELVAGFVWNTHTYQLLEFTTLRIRSNQTFFRQYFIACGGLLPHLRLLGTVTFIRSAWGVKYLPSACLWLEWG